MVLVRFVAVIVIVCMPCFWCFAGYSSVGVINNEESSDHSLAFQSEMMENCSLTETLNIPPSELNALKDLFYSTNGMQWDWKQGAGAEWNFSGNPNPCIELWQGVNCTHLNLNDSFVHVTHVELRNYRLVGSIPNEFSNLTELIEIALRFNNLTGTIPSRLGSLQSLVYLDVSHNSLTGTIPSNLGYAAQLTYLYLDVNALTGTIPSTLAFAGRLSYLFLDFNAITGSIPGNLELLSGLKIFSITDNALTGSIPSSLGSASQLTHLALQINSLSGVIPSSLGSLTRLESLNMVANSLTGTIPSSFGSAMQLKYLYIERNHLSGAIPSALGSLTQLGILRLSFNDLTGFIPASIWGLRNMTVLDLKNNYLKGTISSSIERMENLVYLYLGDNDLTGSIPSSLAKLPNMVYLSIFNNSLVGSLNGVFNSSIQTSLVQVDLHNNQLTGPLPVELFRIASLSIAALASNCFTGTLPTEVCGQSLLKDLILDGLHSASTCQNKIWALSESYIIHHGISGSIPPCVFSLPQLQALHLSGNGLTGSLPDDLNISNITELILSHNSLTGPIPATFQNHFWARFDVSYNRLSGSLASTFGLNMPSKSTVYVQNNRLSGEVPSYLVDLEDVSALGSNMFSCNRDKSDLPQHDSAVDNYQCGSDAFNGPWYFLLAVVAVLLLLLIVSTLFPDLFACIQTARSYWNRYRLPKSSLPYSCQQVYSMVEILCQVSVFSTIVILVVLVPWYSVAHHYWGTYTHSYAWVVSAAFLAGLTPGVVDLCLFSALLCYVVILMISTVKIFERKGSPLKEIQTSSDSEVNRPPTSRMLGFYVFVVVINTIAVVSANVAFVTATLKVSSGVLTLVQFLLSLFKYLWNSYFVKRIEKFVLTITGHRDMSIGFFAMQNFMGIINFIVIPCTVVAALSPSCFYSIIDTPRNVESVYGFVNCGISSGVFYCAGGEVNVSYQPPYIYDYQCSSSFITYYAPTFVYLAITAALVTPALNFSLLYFLSIVKHPHLREVLSYPLPSLLRPSSISSRSVRLGINNLLFALFMYLGILLTFGVVFPPIAAAMCFTILSVSWQMKLGVGRLITLAREAGDEQYQKVLNNIEEDCRDVAYLEKLIGGMHLIVGSAFCFYALFVFDTVGDAEELRGAYWVLIVMPLSSLCIALAMRIRWHWIKTHTKGSMEQPEIELIQRGERELEHSETVFGENKEDVSILSISDKNNTTISALHSK